MPKLPTEDSLSAVVPRPSRGFVAIEPAPLDRSWEGLGEIGQLIDKEFDRIEDLRVNDALNQLRQRRIELSQGEAGFTQKKGAAVVNEPVLDNFQGAFSREIDTIGGNLRTGRARTAFQQRAAQEANAFQMDLLRHVSAQTDAYQESVFAATMENGARTIVLEATKPADVLAEVGKLSDAIEAELDRRGFEAGTPDAEKVREAFRQEALGGALTSAIATLLAEDRSAEAQRIFNEYEKMGAFTAKQIAAIKPKLQSAKDWTVGAALGEQAFSMLLQGKSATEIESYMNKQAGSASELNSARVTYGRMLSARNTQWNENANSAYEEMVRLSGGVNTEATWLQIRSKYVDRMDPSTIIALDKAAAHDAKGESVSTDLEVWYDIKQMETTDPEGFASMDLLKYRDVLSKTDFQRFGDSQRAIREGRRDRNVETVTQIVSRISGENGWNRSKSNPKPKQFQEWLVERIDKEKQETGRVVISDTRIRELAREGLEPVEYERPGILWGTRKTKALRFEYDIEQRGTAAVQVVPPPGAVAPRTSAPSSAGGITVADVPVQAVRIIRQQYAQKFGRQPTPQEIVDLYLQNSQ